MSFVFISFLGRNFLGQNFPPLFVEKLRSHFFLTACLFFSFLLLQCATIEIKGRQESQSVGQYRAFTQEFISHSDETVEGIVANFEKSFYRDKGRALKEYFLLKNEIRQTIEKSPPQNAKLAYMEYLAARFCFYLYTVFVNELEIRVTWLETALGHLKTAQQHRHDSVEINAVFFTVYRHLMRVKGITGTLLYRGRVKHHRDRMLALSQGNTVALEQIGLFYMDTVEVFGGNLDKAITAFQEGLKSAPTHHNLHAYLAMCFRRKKNIFSMKQHLALAKQNFNGFYAMAHFYANSTSFLDLQ